jgi:DNA-3-methyladenine glycosylase I
MVCLQVRRDFGSLDKYAWAFVNNKPLSPGYKYSRKIPVKTSKSESISKDMVRRGFRFVGPTVIHSFMQAVGLTNDHLVSCPRHRACCSSATAAAGRAN